MGSRALKNREQRLRDLFGRRSVSPSPSGSSGHRSFAESGRHDPNQGDGQPKQGDFPKHSSSALTPSRQTPRADLESRFSTSPCIPPSAEASDAPEHPRSEVLMEREASRESGQSGAVVDSESMLTGLQGGQQPSQSNSLQLEGLGSLLREVLSRLDLVDAPTSIPPVQATSLVSLTRSHPELASRPSTRPSGPPSSEAAFGSLGPSYLRPRADSREVPQPNLSSDEEDSQLDNLFPGEPSDPFHALSETEEGLRSVPDAPPQDTSFRSLLEKVANVLAFELESPPEDQSRFVQLLRGCSARSRLQVPLHEIIPIALKDACRAPSSVVPTSKRIDRRYLVSDGEGPPLSFHPSAESTIASAAHDRARTHKGFLSAPPDHEARKWDAWGRKIYSSVALGVRVSSYMAHFSQYNHELWSEVAIMAEQLPEDKRKNTRRLTADGLEILRALMQGAWDLGDTTAKGVAKGVTIRRLAWLKGSGFSAEVQHWIADLPFAGGLLFGEQAESALQQLRETKTTIRSLAPLRPSPGQCPSFRPRGGLSARHLRDKGFWARGHPQPNGGAISTRVEGLPSRVKPQGPGIPSRRFDMRPEHRTNPSAIRPAPSPLASPTCPWAAICLPFSWPGRPYLPISGCWR
nr:PREDICTED: uncharacterized protein LOC106705974 [Latimeria chalumnae]|eukprot:XP_014351693.1 PREDICTED: uncharacterized protein LOC106705974 [Latimeria chalumnae]